MQVSAKQGLTFIEQGTLVFDPVLSQTLMGPFGADPDFPRLNAIIQYDTMGSARASSRFMLGSHAVFWKSVDIAILMGITGTNRCNLNADGG
jgi:hypothetical protein